MPIPLNINGVTCTVAHSEGRPGIVRRWTDSGPEIDVRFLVPWSNCQSLAAALKGYITTNDDGTIIRVPPYNLPFAPQMFCMNLADEEPFTPIVGFDGWMSYGGSIITATFGALTWQIADDDPTGRVDPSGLAYTTTRFRVSTEVYSPPTGSYYVAPFGSGAKRLSEGSIGFIRPQVEISMTRHWMAKIPLQASMELIGSVNDEEITFADRTFPRGCLLFAGMETDPHNDPNGFPVHEIPFTFLGHYEAEWNEVVTDDGSSQLVNTLQDGTGDFPFPYVDFSPLFDDSLGES